MSIKYGSEITTDSLGNDSTISRHNVYRNSVLERSYKTYRLRVRADSPKQQMAEFIRFNTMLKNKQEILMIDKSKPETLPAFVFEPPQYIIKCWTELV